MNESGQVERGRWQRLQSCVRADVSHSARPIQRRTVWLMFLWVLVVLTSGQSVERGWVPGGIVAWAVAVLPALLGVLVLRSYRDLLQAVDELTRRINLEGLATGFAAGFLALVSYPSLERVGAPAGGLDEVLLLAMAVGAAAGIIAATRRYR